MGYVGNSSASYQHLSGPEKEENIHKQISMVREYQACGYKYVYMVRCLPPRWGIASVCCQTQTRVCCCW